ncbi:DNA topoisomerase IV subunit A [Kocuria rhizophila]|uniref:DNA gyrase/topoisomerase IV subunit A n=1 Tax=Kocuria TaxID=57493 RepID=UPI0007505108|nr:MULTISPECIES: DNA topoisomerase IV subunit A [Kocuria]WIW68407.1 DNA topoisomerase IV subunit A [Kocuria sp. ChxB]KUP28009.1 DNA topoisomerase IV [Kocuria rhizophila]MCR4525642.1 DNA topoisomerase IV subunit A [Kocuria rhizophila]MCT1545212.1 DNA topoisomerase IV subunit A [Kocuria rhizophila]MCT2171617.1 DNA topoisomerase IV subunit A [Kocuria rhizophila]
MARRRSATRSPQDDLPEDFVEHIVDVDVTQEMETSFLEYSYSVIYSRALPDARDGLKPVQRRILFMMDQMGLRPDRGHVKSARVVGEVMGKLHPHGDAAIYDAMVRMAQSFAMRVPLVDGHGNFGSLDDGPAAPRYTEARMAPAARTLTGDLDEDVVDFVPNYDNQFQQPAVLPAAYPNLLVNGATGIAVGMATNMAPHNMREVAAGARHLVLNPEATLEELMKLIPGPDLPSGGRIVGLEGIRDAYRTGRGSFRTRATVSIEQVSPRKQGIVVTELPYMVGPEKVTEKIKDAVQAKKLTGISDVVDLTDRTNGLRLVIEVKNGFNPQAVLAQLYKHTPLEESFGINNVALVDGQPRTMGLLELLRVYTDHRIAVVRRRTAFRLSKRQDRLHLVEGLLIAIVDIDEVIQIIRGSEETAEARDRLIAVFDLSRAQAEHILELRLRQLTKFSRIELEAERDQLQREIAELEAILGSETTLRGVVADELSETAQKFGDERRTVLLEAEDLPAVTAAQTGGKKAVTSVALEISDDQCWAFLSTTGRIARSAARTPLADGSRRFKHDALTSVVPATARGEIAAVTSTGRMLRVSCVDIPVLQDFDGVPRLADGVPAADFLGLEKNEALVGLTPLNEVVVIGTAAGVVKRVNPDYPLNLDQWSAIKLKDGDRVVGVGAAPDAAELVMVSSDAKLLHFPASAVRPQGRTAGGVAGMKLAAGEHVIFCGAVIPQESTVVVTQARGDGQLPEMGEASVKVTPLSEFPPKGRATAGVRAQRLLAGEDTLNLAWVGHGPGKAVSAAGVARSLPTEYGRRDGSGVGIDRAVAAVGPALTGLPVEVPTAGSASREDADTASAEG